MAKRATTKQKQNDQRPIHEEKADPHQGDINAYTSVAVIGDVTVDWAFISQLPTRTNHPIPHPWTQLPNAQLYAIPGGAWYSGHMIQGALAAPVFYRYYHAHITQSPKDIPTAVTVRGNLEWFPNITAPDKAKSFLIHARLHKGVNRALLIINETEQLVLDGESHLEIDIPWTEDVTNGKLDIGLYEAKLAFCKEDTQTPGHISPDQIARVYHAINMQIQPSRASIDRNHFLCTHFSMTDFPLTVRLLQSAKHPRKSDPLSSHGEEKRNVHSIRIVDEFHLHTSSTRPSTLEISTNAAHGSLFLKSAEIDVSYGQLYIRSLVSDKGKLNPPHTEVWDVGSGDSRAPHVGSRSNVPDLMHVTTLAPMKSDTIDASRQGEMYGSQFTPHPLGGRHRIWFYGNPGPSLLMQSPSHIISGINEWKLYDRHLDANRGVSPKEKVFRRSRSLGVNGPQYGFPTVLDFYDDAARTIPSRDASARLAWGDGSGNRIVVIDDLGYGFCSRPDKWCPYLYPLSERDAVVEALSQNGVNAPEYRLPLLSADVQHKCALHLQNTVVVIKCSEWLNERVSALLRFLDQAGASDRVIIVASGHTMRTGFIDNRSRPGIQLSKTISWEKTYEDFRTALRDGKLDALASAKHLVVRLGLEGVVHWERIQTDPASGVLRLFFDPARIEGEFAPLSTSGDVPGRTSVLVAAIIQRLSRSLSISRPTEGVQFSHCLSKVLRDSIPYGVQCARRHSEIGYGPTPDTIRRIERLQLPLTQIFGSAPLPGCVDDGSTKMMCYEEPVTISPNASSGGETTTAKKQWSFLTEYLSRKVRNDTASAHSLSSAKASAVARGVTALQIGRKIVVDGVSKALGGGSVAFPYAKFGSLLSVERREIEGLRSIRNLFSEYLDHPERTSPLSIAVFGPPGSGKSFGVQQIARQVAKQARIREFVFNLAQFSSFSDLSRSLLPVRDAALDEEFPLVFFDEFDCRLGGDPLGWLRFFLAPMQDGKFQHDGSMLGIGKALFVFAGGIASTHGQFVSGEFWTKRYNLPSGTDVYSAAKGPDFHSRLRGYLEIVGPNPPMGSDVSGAGRIDDLLSHDDFTFILRRALLIRQQIERMATADPSLLDSEQRVEVDQDVLDALLLSMRFIHGVRSLQAIVEMATLHGARAFSKTAIPPSGQCLMHVDESFIDLVQGNHSRLESEIVRAICSGS